MAELICRKFPHKKLHLTKAEALAHRRELKRKLGEEVVVNWFTAYACGDHWHLGRDWRRFNRQLKNALRVGTAVSKQSRVRRRK